MRSAQLLAAVFALSSLSAAWPWPADKKGVSDIEGLIFKRQGNGNNGGGKSSSSNNNNKSKGPISDNNKPTPKPTGKSGSASDTKATKTTGKTDSPKNGGSKTTGSKGSHTTQFPSGKTFGPSVPPGGISMLTPAAISGPQYFKIGDYVTFGWNYTSLKVTPDRIDVLATCTLNQATYTIAANQSSSHSGLAVWDTEKDTSGKAPLVMASYTLIIKDAEAAVTAVPSPGYLSSYEQFQFAMYSPQPKEGLRNYVCATCPKSAASSTREILTMVFGTAALTVLSFGWFARGVFGLF